MLITKTQKFWLESDFVFELLDNIPAYIFWKDTDSIYLGCNNAFAHSLGLSSSTEVMGKTDYDLPTTKEESDTFRADDKQVIESKQPKLNIEEYQSLPNGRRVVLLTNKVPLFNKEKEVIGILGIYYDITERKNREEELRVAKENAESANEAKSDFIYNMEHDIRTPFNGIWGLSKILWEKENDPSKKEFLKHIVNSAKGLLDFCNDILDFTRSELSVVPVVHQRFHLKQLIEKIIDMERPPAIVKNLELLLEVDPSLPDEVFGDSYRLQRILINLLSNAIKFTEKGYIKLRVVVAKKAGKRNLLISFYIEDSGIGIPENKKQFIFEKFTRLDASNRGVYKGSGLGLRVVKQFIQELEGDFELETCVGKGSTFTCTLPFMEPLIQESKAEP